MIIIDNISTKFTLVTFRFPLTDMRYLLITALVHPCDASSCLNLIQGLNLQPLDDKTFNKLLYPQCHCPKRHQWWIIGAFYIQHLIISTFGYHGMFISLLIILYFWDEELWFNLFDMYSLIMASYDLFLSIPLCQGG